MFGILVVDKPTGITSTGVVNAVRRRFGVKVGHTGTLDPLASGVLPLLIGEATKIARYLLHDSKVYETVMHLGVVTDTLDTEGRVLETRPVEGITEDIIRSVMNEFLGEQDQIPPAYSAIKVDGRRAYDLARKGEEVNLKPRRITVHSLELLEFDGTRARLRMDVSGGTYVRSLVRDMGEKLGCGAHVAELRRLRHGPFSIDSAIPFERIMEMGSQELRSSLRPVYSAFPSSTKVTIDPFTAWLLLTGRSAEWVVQDEEVDPHDLLVLMSEDGKELGLAKVSATGLSPLKIFGKTTQKYAERRKAHVQ